MSAKPRIKPYDREAYTKAWENRALVFKVIKDRHPQHNDRDQLFAVGLESLYNAIVTHDDRDGIRFGPYAYMCIKRGIEEEVYSKLVRVPTTVRRMARQHERGRLDLGKFPQHEQQWIKDACRALSATISQESALASPLSEIHPCRDEESRMEIDERQQLAAAELKRLFARLPAAQGETIARYYGLFGSKETTTREMADEAGITQSAIQIRIARGLKALKRISEAV